MQSVEPSVALIPPHPPPRQVENFTFFVVSPPSKWGENRFAIMVSERGIVNASMTSIPPLPFPRSFFHSRFEDRISLNFYTSFSPYIIFTSFYFDKHLDNILVV